jgi:hypothetical protein
MGPNLSTVESRVIPKQAPLLSVFTARAVSNSHTRRQDLCSYCGAYSAQKTPVAVCVRCPRLETANVLI